jgi:tRNA threonylcarbamoyladenosine biosynthesis protein TsaB
MVETNDNYILAVDTATPCSTVALTWGTREEGRVLAASSASSSVTHSRRLLVAIDRLLTDCGIEAAAIKGYAVGLGPGSFTGLRIGMATVKGLAAAAGRPLHGVSTLDMIAAGVNEPGPLRVVLDARKKEVYTALYQPDADGRPVRITPIIVVSPQQLARQITEPVLMVGDGLFVYKDLWRSELGELVRFAPVHQWSPNAAILGLLAGEQLARGESLDLGSAVPLYVRASDAELNLKMPGG